MSPLGPEDRVTSPPSSNPPAIPNKEDRIGTEERDQEVEPPPTSPSLGKRDPINDATAESAPGSSASVPMSTTFKVMSSTWEKHKGTITRLYVVEGRRLTEVMAIMARDYNIHASQKMFKTRLKRWSLTKNLKREDMESVLRIKTERDMMGKDTVFKVGDKTLTADKVGRIVRRYRSTLRDKPVSARDRSSSKNTSARLSPVGASMGGDTSTVTSHNITTGGGSGSTFGFNNKIQTQEATEGSNKDKPQSAVRVAVKDYDDDEEDTKMELDPSSKPREVVPGEKGNDAINPVIIQTPLPERLDTSATRLRSFPQQLQPQERQQQASNGEDFQTAFEQHRHLQHLRNPYTYDELPPPVSEDEDSAANLISFFTPDGDQTPKTGVRSTPPPLAMMLLTQMKMLDISLKRRIPLQDFNRADTILALFSGLKVKAARLLRRRRPMSPASLAASGILTRSNILEPFSDRNGAVARNDEDFRLEVQADERKEKQIQAWRLGNGILAVLEGLVRAKFERRMMYVYNFVVELRGLKVYGRRFMSRVLEGTGGIDEAAAAAAATPPPTTVVATTTATTATTTTTCSTPVTTGFGTEAAKDASFTIATLAAATATTLAPISGDMDVDGNPSPLQGATTGGDTVETATPTTAEGKEGTAIGSKDTQHPPPTSPLTKPEAHREAAYSNPSTNRHSKQRPLSLSTHPSTQTDLEAAVDEIEKTLRQILRDLALKLDIEIPEGWDPVGYIFCLPPASTTSTDSTTITPALGPTPTTTTPTTSPPSETPPARQRTPTTTSPTIPVPASPWKAINKRHTNTHNPEKHVNAADATNPQPKKQKKTTPQLPLPHFAPIPAFPPQPPASLPAPAPTSLSAPQPTAVGPSQKLAHLYTGTIDLKNNYKPRPPRVIRRKPTQTPTSRSKRLLEEGLVLIHKREWEGARIRFLGVQKTVAVSSVGDSGGVWGFGGDGGGADNCGFGGKIGISGGGGASADGVKYRDILWKCARYHLSRLAARQKVEARNRAEETAQQIGTEGEGGMSMDVEDKGVGKQRKYWDGDGSGDEEDGEEDGEDGFMKDAVRGSMLFESEDIVGWEDVGDFFL